MSSTLGVLKRFTRGYGRGYVHHLLAAVIITAHASQIGQVVEHLNWIHLVVAIAVFSVWFATSPKGHSHEDLA